jgi:hypothetical protein
MCMLCRDEAAHLRHDRDQGVLPEKSGLASHIGAGDQPDAAAPHPTLPRLRGRVGRGWRRQIAVIGNEGRAIARQGLFHHRMPATFDDEGMAVVDMRPCKVALGGKLSECACHIETGKGLGAILDVGALRNDASRQPLENFQL